MEVAAKATPPVWKLVNLKQVFRDSRLREKKERKQALEQRRKVKGWKKECFGYLFTVV